MEPPADPDKIHPSNVITTVVHTSQPTPQMLSTPYPQNIDSWNTDLYGCFDNCGLCMYGCCCSLCLLSQITTRLGEPDGCDSACCGDMAAMRTKLRTLFGISGTIAEDTWMSFCCSCCVIIQMEKELKSRGL